MSSDEKWTRRVMELLTASGIVATDAEVAVFAQAYLGFRQGLDSLYADEALRYEEPATVFRLDTGAGAGHDAEQRW